MSDKAKSILPDGLDEQRLVIIKSCSYLRLTDEIRIAAVEARNTGRTFILAASDGCVMSPALTEFLNRNGMQLLRVRE